MLLRAYSPQGAVGHPRLRFWGANKRVIKHLCRHRNKHTHFSAFPALPAKKALNVCRRQTLHFSFISPFFGASATACDADGSLSRLLRVPPREQLLPINRRRFHWAGPLRRAAAKEWLLERASGYLSVYPSLYLWAWPRSTLFHQWHMELVIEVRIMI